MSNETFSRREFLRNTSAVAATAAVSFPSILHAQAKQPFKAAILGCGGRGRGAGGNFLEAAKIVGVDAEIVALADIFPDPVDKAVKQFKLPPEKCFTGFDAYKKALEVPGVNYAIIATPPGFRPAFFKACIEAGKHVFMEKPVAVDGPGCRIMYAAGQLAQQKGLKVAAGTQRRHQAGYIETIKRIQDGAIGDIVTLRAYWVNGGPIWHRGDKGQSDLEKQIANWYHYIWLCGDHICEQHVHNIDVCNWIMNDHPVKAWGQGSRQQLDDPRFGGPKSGEIWDNFDVEFEYANGVRMFSYCGQIKRKWSSVSEAVHGTKGTSNPSGTIKADGKEWKSTLRLESNNPYVQEHVALMKAILNNTELNETKNVTDSTLTAIMGREAAYSGSAVEWDAILNSKFCYGPELVYEDPSKMTWGPFRTLKPPMPSMHDILKDPPVIASV
ncbi:MAG: Gfo/Idh/MocA family oxidoreductase [Verrucomicrobiae bacterium]|nr:Gfo/Idh/MocA family oxidoreductase [Verrucomicrobiae bacterium]